MAKKIAHKSKPAGSKVSREQKEIEDRLYRLGFLHGVQWGSETLQYALSEGYLSRPKIKEACLKATKVMEQFGDAVLPNRPEADYCQAKIDSRLLEIWLELFQPFPERYDGLKECI